MSVGGRSVFIAFWSFVAVLAAGCGVSIEEPPAAAIPPSTRTVSEASQKLESFGFVLDHEDSAFHNRILYYKLLELSDGFFLETNITAFGKTDLLRQIAFFVRGEEGDDPTAAYAKAIDVLTSLVPDAEAAYERAIATSQRLEDGHPRDFGEAETPSGWDVRVITTVPDESAIAAFGFRTIVAQRDSPPR